MGYQIVQVWKASLPSQLRYFCSLLRGYLSGDKCDFKILSKDFNFGFIQEVAKKTFVNGGFVKIRYLRNCFEVTAM